MKRFPSKRRRRVGFTLVEVLLVMVILVIIAALSIRSYGGAQRKAFVNAAKTQVQELASCVEQYNIDCRQYPQSLDSLVRRRRTCPIRPAGAVPTCRSPRSRWTPGISRISTLTQASTAWGSDISPLAPISSREPKTTSATGINPRASSTPLARGHHEVVGGPGAGGEGISLGSTMSLLAV